MRGEAGTDTEVSSFPVHPRLRKLRAPYVRSDWLSGARVGLSGRLRGGRYTGSEFGRRGRVLCGAAGGMEAAAAEPGNLAGVRHIILVLSGKGGVGKSTISTELALALRHAGKKVSTPTLAPARTDLCSCPSWTSCLLAALIKQFVSDVAWGQLDYLVVDTPPGTSDEHMATVEALRPYSPLGALVVTTPQVVSVGDVRRELTFCRKTGLQVVGVVENMSGFVCPHCAECTNVFSRGGGEELARLAGVPFLGSVPLDPELTRSLEEGRDFIRDFPNSPAFPALSSIAQKVLSQAPARLS
ncbi:cytosolic Fe-S cluster assembly factor NUBP2 isoform X3 [Ursus arctos]|uniref:cytosolic Fe-S cluster assembly factor NUBP2 isoform X3 n=1 Tax=Ursus arctos TaxID=9644 RepID=UPI0025465DFD|nr:cytosolic Fe-S cluster assembly factor NUBP2 isoform X3 [Ursus arctos]